MLRQTFIHLPGVGTHREQTLWKQGILDWDRFLEAVEDGALRQGIYESAAPLVRQSLDAVAAGDAGFFHDRLPSRETWRLYPDFADRALFLDIETTGLSPDYSEVTVSRRYSSQSTPAARATNPMKRGCELLMSISTNDWAPARRYSRASRTRLLTLEKKRRLRGSNM